MKEATGIILVIAVFVIGISMFLGAMDTLMARESGLSLEEAKSGCEYKSYASRYNPFYRGVCELFRDRTFTPHQ